MPKLRAFIDFVRANLDLISEPAPARGGNSPA